MNTEQAERYLDPEGDIYKDPLPTTAEMIEVRDESSAEIWDAFKPNAKRRRITRPQFDAILLDFYELTLEPFINGNLGRRDGTAWKSKHDALDYFGEIYGGRSPGYFIQSWMRAVEKQCGGYT